MSRLKAVGAFLYDFIVGDDVTIAIAVVAGLTLTALVAGAGFAAWWILPIAVVATLAHSVRAASTSGTAAEPCALRNPVPTSEDKSPERIGPATEH